MSAATGDRRLAELQDERAALLARWNAPGPDIDEARVDALCDELAAIDEAIAATQAHDVAGILLKAQVLDEDLVQGAGCSVELLAASIRADLEQLVRAAGSPRR